MSRDELKVMDGGKCILEIRGARPFFSDKFDITKHKNYKQLSDYNKKNGAVFGLQAKEEIRIFSSVLSSFII